MRPPTGMLPIEDVSAARPCRERLADSRPIPFNASEDALRDAKPPVPAAPWVGAALVLVGLLIAALSFQSGRGLWDPDEGRYTGVALEMLDSGDWLLPRLNDHREHLTKPPLTYWALGAAFTGFGRTEAAARLPNALAFVLTGFMLWLFARAFGLRRPWIAPVVWGSALLPLLAANVVTTDTLLACWQTLAVYGGWRMLTAPRQGQARWRLVMWAAFGLGFLTKGPPALLPLISLLVVGWWWPDARWPKPKLLDIPSALTFLVLGLGWFAWLLVQRPELLEYYLGHEVFDRVFTGVHGRNAAWYGAITVYVPALFLAVFPWGLYAAAIRRRPSATAAQAEPREPANRSLRRRLLRAWLLIPLAVFFIAQSRLVLYVLPLAVPLSLLIAGTLDTHWRAGIPRAAVIALCGWAAVALALKGASTGLSSTKDARALAGQVAQLAPGARRIVFVDVAAHYGLRFYLGVPVEHVGSTVQHAPVAHGQRAHLLCEELALSPGAAVIGRGMLLGDAAARATRPVCPGWTFSTPRPGSGLWLALPRRQVPSDAGLMTHPQGWSGRAPRLDP